MMAVSSDAMWKQIGHRPNYYFDCETMQAAAATMLKLIGREATMFAEQPSKAPTLETRELVSNAAT